MIRVTAAIAFICLATLVLLLPGTVLATVDWEISGAVQLDETPLDVAQTTEGDLTFLLTDKATVLIYSGEGKQIGVVPVDADVTDIAVSAKGGQLYLINSKRKTLQIVDISFVVDINTSGSPFLGPAAAGVTVAVFSDFQ